MFVKPVEGRQVPDPEKGGFLVPEGRSVEPTQYWLRRVEEQDVEVDDKAAKAALVVSKGVSDGGAV